MTVVTPNDSVTKKLFVLRIHRSLHYHTGMSAFTLVIILHNPPYYAKRPNVFKSMQDIQCDIMSIQTGGDLSGTRQTAMMLYACENVHRVRVEKGINFHTQCVHMYSQMGTLVNRLQAWMLIKACTHAHTHTHTHS